MECEEKMIDRTYDPITYTRFTNLITEFYILEDLLRYFEENVVKNIDRNRNILEPIIIKQIKFCNRYQQGIRAHLEECKEWDSFPEEFWDETNTEQHSTSPSKRTIFPLNSDLSTNLDFIVQAIRHTMEIEDKCLKDYQYSGYIDHQPVSIDFLDFLIDTYGQLYDTHLYLNKILQDNSNQLTIHLTKEC